MNEMMERVARAIADTDHEGEGWGFNAEQLISLAHAAIAAMLEPTEAMILAGAKAAADQHYYKANSWGRYVRPDLRQDWLNAQKYGHYAMIEAAIQEPTDVRPDTNDRPLAGQVG